MKKFKIKEQEIFANSLRDALEIYKHKVKDSTFVFGGLDPITNEDKKYFKGIGLTFVNQSKDGPGYEYVFKGSRSAIMKYVNEQELDKEEYEIKDSKIKDEVYYEDIDSSSEAKKYAKKFGLEVEGRRAPWGGYEFAFEGNPQDLKKLVQELKKIGIEPTWSSVGDSKVKDKNNVYEMQYINTAKKYTNIDKFRAPSLAEAMTRINLIAYVEDSRRRDILVKSIKENGIDLNISGRGDALLKKYNSSAWSTGTLGYHYDDSIGDSKVKDFSPNQLQYCLDEMELAIDDIQKLSRKIVSYKNRYFELIKEAKSLASTDKEKQVQIAFWEKQFARAQSAYRASEGAL